MKPTNDFERKLMSLVNSGKVHPLTRSEIKQALHIWKSTKENRRYKYFYFQNTQTIDDVKLVKAFKGYKETFGTFYFQLVAIRATDSNGNVAYAGVSRTLGCYVDTFKKYGEITIKKPSTHGYYTDLYEEVTNDFGIDVSAKSRVREDVGLIFNLGYNTKVIGKGSKKCPLNTRIETMVERGYTDFASHLIDYTWFINTYWSTIKIVMKNNYRVKDWNLYIDYIRMLERNGKDVRNSFYVCPKNFMHSHDWITRIENIRAEEVARQLAHSQDRYADEDEFNKYHSYLFGIAFDNGHVFLKSLDSVKAYKDEGNLMSHCVGGYWSHCSSLILHCSDVKGNAIATIEIDMAHRRIVQIRAKHNNRPKEFNEITNVIKENMEYIPQFKPMKKSA